jgi:Fic family protein
VHREFCKQLPEELLVVSDPKTGREEKVVPGDLRKILVKVGQHIPPAPDDLAPLLDRFVTAYGNDKLPRIQRIIGVAASHHRLLWIHPFPDGNGRVTRLYRTRSLKSSESVRASGLFRAASPVRSISTKQPCNPPINRVAVTSMVAAT